MPFFSSGTTAYLNPVLIFIDGGYLREQFQRIMRHENINFPRLQHVLHGFTGGRTELIRVYYYDANVDATVDVDMYKKLDAYFETIREFSFYEIKLGRLIKQGNGSYKQKGVDVLIAIDMITKAYEGQYEIAVLLAGDDDFVDVVNAVKNAGKRVYGAFFPESISKRLKHAFDQRFILSHDIVDQFTVKKE